MTNLHQPPVTELHRQSASGFLCWPMNVLDLCQKDSDLPKAVEALAAFIARWEAKGAEAEREACAKLIEPKARRPCDCEPLHCYCQNQGDADAVAAWDADTWAAGAIRARAKSPAVISEEQNHG